MLVGLFLFLGCCVCLDFLISGRVRFLVLLNDANGQPSMPPPPEQYQAARDAHSGMLDERLVPGVPQRDLSVGGYGSSGVTALVGAVPEREWQHTRLCVENARGAGWAVGGKPKGVARSYSEAAAMGQAVDRAGDMVAMGAP